MVDCQTAELRSLAVGLGGVGSSLNGRFMAQGEWDNGGVGSPLNGRFMVQAVSGGGVGSYFNGRQMAQDECKSLESTTGNWSLIFK